MRILVIGTSGVGKSTLARKIAARLGLRYIELDGINWQPGWYDLSKREPKEFARRVSAAAEADEWVLDGAYNKVRDLLWLRATHLVWLDYDRPVVMARVIGRSLARVVLRTELWPGTGNRERWVHLLDKTHPIRWSWDHFDRRRAETRVRLQQPDYAKLTVAHLRHPHEASRFLARLPETWE